MLLQVDNEFQLVKYDVKMFMTAVNRGKALAAEAQEQNSKTECPKDEGTTHNHDFGVCREYE